MGFVGFVMSELTWAANENLVWVDIETTGLNPTYDEILEIGVMVTGPPPSFMVRNEVSVVIKPETSRFSRSRVESDKNLIPKFHLKNGLLAQVWEEGQFPRGRSDFLLGWLSVVTAGAPGPMCGSSPQFDRSFLDAIVPGFTEKVWTYRNFDVSTLAELVAQLRGRQVVESISALNGPVLHRSLPDLRDSVLFAHRLCAELKGWR